VKLTPAGREYATWSIAGLPEPLSVSVSFDGLQWHPTTREGDTVRLLVAGPDATDNPEGTAVLHLGRNAARLRVVDHPEILIRAAGAVHVV